MLSRLAINLLSSSLWRQSSHEALSSVTRQRAPPQAIEAIAQAKLTSCMNMHPVQAEYFWAATVHATLVRMRASLQCSCLAVQAEDCVKPPAVSRRSRGFPAGHCSCGTGPC